MDHLSAPHFATWQNLISHLKELYSIHPKVDLVKSIVKENTKKDLDKPFLGKKLSWPTLAYFKSITFCKNDIFPLKLTGEA